MRRAAFEWPGLAASFRVRLAILLLAVLALGLAAVTYAALAASRQLLLPEIEQKAQAVGGSLSAQVERALALGVPLNELVGVDASFRSVLDANREFAGIILRTVEKGAILAMEGTADDGGGTIAVPVHFEGKQVAQIEVTNDPGFVQRTIRGLWSDLAVVLLISVLIALELMALLFGPRLVSVLEAVESRLRALNSGDFRRHPTVPLTSPLGRAPQAFDRMLDRARKRHETLVRRARASADGAAQADLETLAADLKLFDARDAPPATAESIRAPLFLFMFALEMTRPFLPGYIDVLASDHGVLPRAVAVGGAMALYMGIVAALQLPLAVQTARWGRGLSFRVGAGVATIGYLICGFSLNLPMFLAGHGLSAIGFALVFVAAQGHVIDTCKGGSRVRGLAVMVGAIMVAGLCGPAVGGMLVEQLGASMTYLVIALFGLLSLVIGSGSIPVRNQAEHGTVSRPPDARPLWAGLVSSPTFGVFLLGCALPAKLILFALCFYLVPVQMAEQGATASEIGRMQIVYPVATVLLVPVFSRLSRHLDMRLPFVMGGALLTGLACLYVLLPGGDWVLFLLLLQFGVAQAMSITPQAGLVGELASRIGAEDSAFGLYRLVERAGSALGPIAAGILLASYGFEATVLGLGGVVVAGAAVSLIVIANTRRPPRLEDVAGVE